MEAFVSAVVGDLISRLISTMIKRYSESQSMEEKLQRLQQLLLRVRIIVEEAQGRDITNEGMLLQLKMLMEAMYQGYFIQDAFKYGALAEKGDDDVRHSLAMSDIIYPRKRQCFATGVGVGCEAINQLKFALANLGSVIDNLQEFLTLLGRYPRMFRQPYNSYLFVDNCLFGRQIERQQIINFLLEKDSNSSTRKLSVLSIVGPRGVGKKTLVEHACNDERVLHYYSSILRIIGNDLQKRMLSEDESVFPAQRCLIIVQFDSEFDEAAWGRFYFSACSMASAGSKIIITSRADEISSFGTTQPLTLKYLPTNEYWYFFKLIAFGSSNADEHPRLASFAMEIAAELKGSFIFANVFGRVLRANFDAQFWCRILENWRKSMQKNLLLFEETPADLVAKSHPYYHRQMGMHSKVYLLYNYHSTGSLNTQLPKVTGQDLVAGRNIPTEKEFQMLGWKSLVPPYHSYIASCIVKEKSRGMVSKKKVTNGKVRATRHNIN